MTLHTELQLDHIDASDLSFQVRQQKDLDELNVENFVNSSVDQWPPIKVISRNNKFSIVSGFHRFAAASELGLDTIKAEILDVGLTDIDVRIIAYRDNTVNGKQLTLAEKKEHAVLVYLKEPSMPHYKIAQLCGIRDKTVTGAIKAYNKTEHEKVMATIVSTELPLSDMPVKAIDPVDSIEVTKEIDRKEIDRIEVAKEIDLEKAAKSFKRAILKLFENSENDILSIVKAIMLEDENTKEKLIELHESVIGIALQSVA